MLELTLIAAQESIQKFKIKREKGRGREVEREGGERVRVREGE